LRTVLVHLASGIGNVVLATPLLVALEELGFRTHVWLDADYAGTAELLDEWSAVASTMSGPPADVSVYSHVIPAAPPFYWSRYANVYSRLPSVMARPADSVFYENEQAFYLSFARSLGYPTDRAPAYRLPVAPDDRWGVSARTIVLAPGCKTGEMATKRWPYFPQLSACLEDVCVVGTPDDMRTSDGSEFIFAPHVRSFVGQLTLRETAELLACAGLVVGNDSGLSHIAAAVGTPTLMIFGPTPDVALGPLPSHVRVLRAGLACEPCWRANRFVECNGRIECLRQIDVNRVLREIGQLTSM
jgi:ADP-heptose:LPS heptosyltransferase